MSRTLHYDAVVVGAGMTGLVSGIRLAQAGASVCVVAQGYGSLLLSPGTVDEPIEADVAEWFAATVAAGPFRAYRYEGAHGGGVDVNGEMLLPTALGTLKRVLLAPSTMVAGAVVGGDQAGSDATLGEKPAIGTGFSPRVARTAGNRVVIIGSPGFRDLQATLCAANLAASGLPARAVEFDWRLDRADANSVLAARCFDDDAWRDRFIDALMPLLDDGDAVIGLPAVLGLRGPGVIHAELQQRLGRPVFEIPTLPPSVPGMRLFTILRAALRADGGKLVIGPGCRVITCPGDDDGRVRAVKIGSAGQPTTLTAETFVFATGAGSVSQGEALTTGYRAGLEVRT